MSTINYSRIEDINKGIEIYKTKSNAILLDVRRLDEYAEGHISNSVNVAVENIEKVLEVITDKNAKIFVYCRSGVRSKKAQEAMVEMGYSNVTEIGGILDYKGNIEK